MRLTLGLALLAMTVAPSGAAQTLLRVNKLEVRDATGKRVADISANRAESGDVALGVGVDGLIFLRLNRQEIEPEGWVTFPTTDCSGPPIVYGSPDSFYRGGKLAGPRRTVYMPGGPVKTLQEVSYAFDGSCDQLPSVAQVRGALGLRTVDLMDYFTPPFTLRALAGSVVERATPQGATSGGLASATTLGVYDSRGTKLGDADPAPDPSTRVAFLTGAGRIFIVEVRPTQLWGNADLYYEGDACTGRAFFRPDLRSNDLEPFTAVIGPRRTVFVGSGLAESRTWRSVRYNGGDICSTWSPVTTPAILAAPAGVDLADYFIPPFSVRPLGLSPVPPRYETEDAEE